MTTRDRNINIDPIEIKPIKIDEIDDIKIKINTVKIKICLDQKIINAIVLIFILITIMVIIIVVYKIYNVKLNQL
jgi:hypothetical protein